MKFYWPRIATVGILLLAMATLNHVTAQSSQEEPGLTSAQDSQVGNESAVENGPTESAQPESTETAPSAAQVTSDMPAKILTQLAQAVLPGSVPQPVEASQPVESQPVAESAEPNPSGPATSDIAVPTDSGVIPSIVHKGDILDFLRTLSVVADKNIVPSRLVKGPVNVHLFNVTFEEALDAVLSSNGFAYQVEGPFIKVYTQKELTDKLAAARKMTTRVFHLNYIPAADVVPLVAPLLSGSESKISVSPDAGQAEENSGEGWAGNNYIIVLDYPENIESIAGLVSEVDRRPPQVMIEATILVAQLDDTCELGIDFNALGGVNFQTTAGVPTIPAGVVAVNGTTTSAGTSFNTNLSGGGLSIGIVKNNIGMFIEALESITDVVTVGNPKVLTLNRQLGKVIVGSEDGYITTEVSTTTATQTVEFLKTGVQLNFRPFVMDDGYIRMELNTEDSDGGVRVDGGFTLPSKSTANVTSNVLIQDGRTIVIGGLFREKTSLSRSQIPLLGDIPGLGVLFRSTSDENNKEEVIFMITPHIVKDQVDYAAAEDTLGNCNRLMLGTREGMFGLSRERLADGYFQRAKKQQAAGKLESALWNADMAFYTSPALIDVLKLRDQLRGQQVYRAETGSMNSFMRNLITASK